MYLIEFYGIIFARHDNPGDSDVPWGCAERGQDQSRREKIPPINRALIFLLGFMAASVLQIGKYGDSDFAKSLPH